MKLFSIALILLVGSWNSKVVDTENTRNRPMGFKHRAMINNHWVLSATNERPAYLVVNFPPSKSKKLGRLHFGIADTWECKEDMPPLIPVVIQLAPIWHYQEHLLSNDIIHMINPNDPSTHSVDLSKYNISYPAEGIVLFMEISDRIIFQEARRVGFNRLWNSAYSNVKDWNEFKKKNYAMLNEADWVANNPLRIWFTADQQPSPETTH